MSSYRSTTWRRVVISEFSEQAYHRREVGQCLAKAALAVYFALYNFVWIHQTLRVTRAMAAGITDMVWNLEELL